MYIHTYTSSRDLDLPHAGMILSSWTTGWDASPGQSNISLSPCQTVSSPPVQGRRADEVTSEPVQGEVLVGPQCTSFCPTSQHDGRSTTGSLTAGCKRRAKHLGPIHTATAFSVPWNCIFWRRVRLRPPPLPLLSNHVRPSEQRSFFL